MAEDLERLMRHAEGEGPSPEFVAKLRERIVEETTPWGESSEVETVVDSDSHDLVKPPTIQRRLLGLAVAATVVVIAGAIITVAGPDLSMIAEQPPSFEAEATLLTDELSHLEAGTYLVETVGTPFTFTLDHQQYVARNGDGRIVIAHPSSQGEGDRSIDFTRLSALSDPIRPTIRPDNPEQGWPVGDFGGWLDNAPDQILISNRRETTLGGLSATRADMEVGEADCRPGVDRCLFLGSNRSVGEVVLRPGPTYRVWVVEQGVEDPLAVVVTIDRESDADWFDTADTILSSLAFGDVGPNPVLPASPGSTELPFLGGIRIELEAKSVALQQPGGFGKVPLGDWRAETQFLFNLRGLDGNALTSTDKLVSSLEMAGVDVTEIEGTVIDGLDARAFDISSDSTVPVLVSSAASDRAWLVPSRGRLWLVEHPDRGLLMISGQVFENLDLVFPLVVDQTEAIIDSLEFIDGG